MFKFLITFALLVGILEARSQTCVVKSFRWLDPQQVKFSPTPIPDVGGKKCAIIRVVSKQSGYDFDFGVPGNVVAAVPKGDDIWLWVPEGVQNVMISNKKLGFLCNYPLGTELEADVVYVMVLDTTKVDKTRQGQIETKWVTLDCDPSMGAYLFIDDISVGKTPFYGSLVTGTHKVRMEMNKEIKEEEITVNRNELNLKISFPTTLAALRASNNVGPIEQSPEFKGGYEEMLKFLRENLHYPKLAEEQKIEGTVFVQFMVSITGEITPLKVLRGIGGGCDEEAMRVIKMMPKWIQGRMYGYIVPVIYQLPIKFQLPKK
jgi:TonB family protein